MSFISTLGSDIKKVFTWISSPKGQAVVAAGEAVVEDVLPAATGAINIINAWGTEIIKAEGIATAAAATGGTADTQKAAAVIQTLTPQVIAFAQANGLPAPTAATLQAVNDSLYAALEALGGTPVVPPAPATTAP